MTRPIASPSPFKRVRILLWVFVALALVGLAGVMLWRSAPSQAPAPVAQSSFGGSFTLVGADGRRFSSQALEGKPYAIYFGFTRCGDVCPTTLSRLVKLRKQAANAQALNIVFVTIDPSHDGPNEVGQYAEMFGSPIIGLTGSQREIDHVKKQYGIFAEPMPHAAMGKEMEHTASVLLFDRAGKFVATIAPDEPDSSALTKLKALAA